MFSLSVVNVAPDELKPSLEHLYERLMLDGNAQENWPVICLYRCCMRAIKKFGNLSNSGHEFIHSEPLPPAAS